MKLSQEIEEDEKEKEYNNLYYIARILRVYTSDYFFLTFRFYVKLDLLFQSFHGTKYSIPLYAPMIQNDIAEYKVAISKSHINFNEQTINTSQIYGGRIIVTESGVDYDMLFKIIDNSI